MVSLICCLFFIGVAEVIAQEPAGPPQENRQFRISELVEIVKLDSTIKLDIRYATAANFTGKAVYPEARAFLQRPAAEALVSVQSRLKGKGYGLVVFDAYRPWSVTRLFWEITPPDKRMFTADPAIGSGHNRGCSVDVGLLDLSTGREVEMPSAYDEMSERSFVTYKGGTREQRAARDLLRKAMEEQGCFFVYPEEWWHYDYKDFRDYATQDIPFSAIATPSPSAIAAQSSRPFVPKEFKVPSKLETDRFRLRMLTVNDVIKDYDAVMTSIEHLQGVFGPGAPWPSAGLTLEQDLIDLGWHQKEFQHRSSFAYTVMNLPETQCLGCVYIFPTTKEGHDAEVILWVRKSEYEKGLDSVLFEAVKKWVSEKWPFKNPGYPGREIQWEKWDSLP